LKNSDRAILWDDLVTVKLRHNNFSMSVIPTCQSRRPCRPLRHVRSYRRAFRIREGLSLQKARQILGNVLPLPQNHLIAQAKSTNAKGRFCALF
jgi:hypothetical protein